MAIKIPSNESELLEIYGDPNSVDFWKNHMTFCHVPDSFLGLKGMSHKGGFYCNKAACGDLMAIFHMLQVKDLAHLVTSFDGCYNNRLQRGSKTKLSLHAFGAAVDLNASTNGLGQVGDMDSRIVEVFESYDWVWGGRWKRPDFMHFERYAKNKVSK